MKLLCELQHMRKVQLEAQPHVISQIRNIIAESLDIWHVLTHREGYGQTAYAQAGLSSQFQI